MVHKNLTVGVESGCSCHGGAFLTASLTTKIQALLASFVYYKQVIKSCTGGDFARDIPGICMFNTNQCLDMVVL